jgi:hypothetical protein
LFLNQLVGIAHDLGFSQYEKVVADDETYPTPLEKLREFRRWLDSRFQGKVLLILDNLESALDEEGLFRDEELGQWFRLLVGADLQSYENIGDLSLPFRVFPGWPGYRGGAVVSSGGIGHHGVFVFLKPLGEFAQQDLGGERGNFAGGRWASLSIKNGIKIRTAKPRPAGSHLKSLKRNGHLCPVGWLFIHVVAGRIAMVDRGRRVP